MYLEKPVNLIRTFQVNTIDYLGNQRTVNIKARHPVQAQHKAYDDLTVKHARVVN